MPPKPQYGILVPFRLIVTRATWHKVRVMFCPTPGLWDEVIQCLGIRAITKKAPPPVLRQEAAAACFMGAAWVKVVEVDQFVRLHQQAKRDIPILPSATY